MKGIKMDIVLKGCNQSFHKKGKSMMESAITIISSPTIRKDSCSSADSLNTSPNAAFDSRISSSNWGIINGNPIMAINAAFCCALAAIAANKVKTKLRLIPPKQTIPVNSRVLDKGFFNKIKNRPKLSRLIISIKMIL